MVGFTFDALVGEFILSHPDIKVPDKGKIYAFNEGNYGVSCRNDGLAMGGQRWLAWDFY